jgi:hypothetical protein
MGTCNVLVSGVPRRLEVSVATDVKVDGHVAPKPTA